jgi:hypothetical protein
MVTRRREERRIRRERRVRREEGVHANSCGI